MSHKIEYNGYLIEPTTRLKRKTSSWTLEVRLTPKGRRTGVRRCRAPNTFPTEELAIARCLMGGPDLVMFDEPSLGLAPAVVQSVLQTIRDLNREGLTCVLVEQNVAVSLKLASRAYVLENGRVTLSGTGEELLADDRVRQAYLGM